MKGRGCLEPGTDHSFCNSGCLGKLNQGQYSSYSSASGGDSLHTPLTPPRRKTSACHLLHLVCLGGIHPFIHPSLYIAPALSGFWLYSVLPGSDCSLAGVSALDHPQQQQS